MNDNIWQAIFIRNHKASLIGLALLPVLANAVALSGFFDTDPTLQFIGLGQNLRSGWIPGPLGWLDPTVGYISQPLGHLVAADWFHGVLPWWNPYSGVGMPLAAEMQTSAFFLPFVLLLHFDCGWLLLRILLQIGSGVFAYLLFVTIGLRRTAAFFGAALYALSPMFFLDPHAAMTPLPFLPLLLLGIEYSAAESVDGGRMGWSLVTISVAYSILGGFPEVAFIDGLLAALWSLWKLAVLSPYARLQFIGKLCLGVGVALGLCAPLLIPFLEYLPRAYLGPHGSTLFQHARLDPTLVPLQIIPFLYGPLGSPPPAPLASTFGAGWIRMPGWVGLPILLLALTSLWRHGSTKLPRYVLLFWVVLWESRYLGFPPIVGLVDLVPGLGAADTTRFSGPAIDFAIFAMASFAFDDYMRLPALTRGGLIAILFTLLAIILAAVMPALSFVFLWWGQKPKDMLVSLGCGLLILAVLAFLSVELRRSRHQRLLVVVLLAAPLIGFTYSQFAGFRGGSIDMAPIRYLQTHIGTGRIVSLGPLDLNFPARYEVASLDYNALPVPENWTDYIRANLFAGEDLNTYLGGATGDGAFLLQHLPAYEALGVRYAVTNSDDDLSGTDFAIVDAQRRNLTHTLIPGGADLTGTIATNLPFGSVEAISVVVGTYFGASRGPVNGVFCAGGKCASATADATTATDNGPLEFTFSHSLDVPSGATLTFRFSHPTGARIAIWFAPSINGSEQPTLNFVGSAKKTGIVPSLVFHDAVASIFELPQAAPYAQTADTGCKIIIVSRQNIETICPMATTLTRRELFFPGWSATVNNVPASISQAGLFQIVQVPAGEAHISFYYAPEHIRLAGMIALFAFGLWLGLVFWNLPSNNARRSIR